MKKAYDNASDGCNSQSNTHGVVNSAHEFVGMQGCSTNSDKAL